MDNACFFSVVVVVVQETTLTPFQDCWKTRLVHKCLARDTCGQCLLLSVVVAVVIVVVAVVMVVVAVVVADLACLA